MKCDRLDAHYLSGAAPPAPFPEGVSMRDWLIGGGFGLAWIIMMAVVAALDRRLRHLEGRMRQLEARKEPV
jgi:hypothetical protein